MKSKTERLENDMESNILEFECVGLNDGGNSLLRIQAEGKKFHRNLSFKIYLQM